MLETLVKPGKMWHPYKVRIAEATQFFAFSTEFGWTPDQIRALDEEDKMMYLGLMSGVMQGREELKNKNKRK